MCWFSGLHILAFCLLVVIESSTNVLPKVLIVSTGAFGLVKVLSEVKEDVETRGY